MLLLSSFLSGCVTTSSDLYYWGGYQAMLDKYYREPGNMPPEVQARRLEAIIDDAQRNPAPVAPGIYAHLGVAYADLGRQADAEAAFAREAELYPESTIWLEGMIARARRTGAEQ